MKRNIFLLWYYTKGIARIFKIWINFIIFFFDFFSIKDLSLTLFSPWKRDVTFKNWRGFQLSKIVKTFIDNLFSRLIGAVVRLLVLILGITIELIIILLFIPLVIFWIVAIPVLVISIFNTILKYSYPFSYEVIFLNALFLILIYFAYRNYVVKDYRKMSLKQIYKDKIFNRVCKRLNVKKSEFKKDFFVNENVLENFLKKINISIEQFQIILDFEIRQKIKQKQKNKFWSKEYLSGIKPIGRQWKYAYTINLDKFSSDLTEQVRESDDIIGREDQIRILNVLLKRDDQNNALLIGDAGIGKWALIRYFAYLVKKRQLGGLNEIRILHLDLKKAISDASNSGKDIGDYVSIFFEEAIYAGNIILVIDEIGEYLFSENNYDLSSIFSKYLEYPQIRVIATSGLGKYHKLIKGKDEVLKFFETIEIPELSNEDTIKVLMQKFYKKERKRIIFTLKALERIVKSSNRYIGNFPRPERAIDLAMNTFSFWKQQNKISLITPEIVNKFLSIKFGINIGKINKEEKEKLINLEKILQKRIVGQKKAVRQVAEALRKIRSGLANPQKPIGSFLFLGPTGVGKTETAKAFSESYFGDENKMIRIDMSEYQSQDSLERLIGSEKNNQPGYLTSQVQDHPFSVLLLDELEKANPNILNLFLQVLDEGFLTDGFGKKINFRNMIIIATSNAGAAIIKDMVEKKEEHKKIKEDVINYAISNNIYRVEFLNRFDDIIFFRPLKDEELEKVTTLLLKKFSKRLYNQKNLNIKFGDYVVKEIIKKGYDPIFGARSIRRYIADNIEDLIAKKIISEDIQEGAEIFIGKESFIN